jgi:hypothetical protein
MSNDTRDVAKRAETALTTADYFERYGQAASGRRFVGDLLKFGKDGIYIAGREGREVKYGTQMVAYMPSLRCGWIRWEDGHLVEGPMGLVADGFVPPKRDTLEGTPDESSWEKDDKGKPVNPWQISNDLALFDPQGVAFYTFATTSKGGLARLAICLRTMASTCDSSRESGPSYRSKAVPIRIGSAPMDGSSFRSSAGSDGSRRRISRRSKALSNCRSSKIRTCRASDRKERPCQPSFASPTAVRPPEKSCGSGR